MGLISRTITGLVAALALAGAAQAESTDFEAAFDRTLGTESRAPKSFNAVYDTALESRIARLADGEKGRIGVAALDLATGQSVSILGDQRFPMASTSKIAIAATFLEGVERGRWSLTSEFPLLIPVRSEKFSSAKAPVRRGSYLPATELIDLMITRSSNYATDALLEVVGGPRAVNDWARRAGIRDFELTRDIATLIRDDGEFDPAEHIDRRDSASPNAMVQLVAGLHQGKWLNAAHRHVIIDAMERCRTGKNRIPALLPASAQVAHKTGTLNRTASDIGLFRTPDGRTIALAIYVTGQSDSLWDEANNKSAARSKRDAVIAEIARELYLGFSNPADRGTWTNASYGGG